MNCITNTYLNKNRSPNKENQFEASVGRHYFDDRDINYLPLFNQSCQTRYQDFSSNKQLITQSNLHYTNINPQINKHQASQCSNRIIQQSLEDATIKRSLYQTSPEKKYSSTIVHYKQQIQNMRNYLHDLENKTFKKDRNLSKSSLRNNGSKERVRTNFQQRSPSLKSNQSSPILKNRSVASQRNFNKKSPTQMSVNDLDRKKLIYQNGSAVKKRILESVSQTGLDYNHPQITKKYEFQDPSFGPTLEVDQHSPKNFQRHHSCQFEYQDQVQNSKYNRTTNQNSRLSQVLDTDPQTGHGTVMSSIMTQIKKLRCENNELRNFVHRQPNKLQKSETRLGFGNNFGRYSPQAQTQKSPLHQYLFRDPLDNRSPATYRSKNQQISARSLKSNRSNASLKSSPRRRSQSKSPKSNVKHHRSSPQLGKSPSHHSARQISSKSPQRKKSPQKRNLHARNSTGSIPSCVSFKSTNRVAYAPPTKRESPLREYINTEQSPRIKLSQRDGGFRQNSPTNRSYQPKSSYRYPRSSSRRSHKHSHIQDCTQFYYWNEKINSYYDKIDNHMGILKQQKQQKYCQNFTTFGCAPRFNYSVPRSPSPSIGHQSKRAINSSLMHAGVPIQTKSSKSRSRTPTRIVGGVLKVGNATQTLTNYQRSQIMQKRKSKLQPFLQNNQSCYQKNVKQNQRKSIVRKSNLLSVGSNQQVINSGRNLSSNRSVTFSPGDDFRIRDSARQNHNSKQYIRL